MPSCLVRSGVTRVTNVAHLLRGLLLPVLVASATTAAAALPAAAAVRSADSQQVARSGQWWLAAGQNTPIRPGGAVSATT